MDWEEYFGFIQHEEGESCDLSQMRPDGTSLGVSFDEDLDQHRRKRIRLDEQVQNPVIRVSPAPNYFHPTACADPLATPTQPIISSNHTTEPYLQVSVQPLTLSLGPQASFGPDSLTVSHSASGQDCEEASC